MNLQYLSDNFGNKTAVVIPIVDWKKITQKYKELETDVVDDWEDSLTNDQIASIERGRKDIAEGRVISHKEAKEKIKQYIQNKTK